MIVPPRGRRATAARLASAAPTPHVQTEAPLTRRSVVEELALRLRERIRREALGPGERLGTRSELARQYGVSAGTVISALRLLEAAGVAAARPGVNGGVFVSPSRPRVHLGRVLLTLRESGDEEVARDAYRSRALLEILLARLAARARDADDIRDLQAALARLEDATGDIARYMRENWELHDGIARAAHNETLLAIYRGLVEVVITDVARISDRQRRRPQDGGNVDLHRRLVESIVRGDVDGATQAAEEHAERVLRGLDGRAPGPRSPRTRQSAT